jgi:hypothetical protein
VSLQPELEGASAPEAEESNPLISLGQQFGQAIGVGHALRSAVGTPASKDALVSTAEPHTRGAIMMNAVFDAFFHVYARRTRPLFRLSAGSPARNGDLHPDLVRRLAAEASQIASTFLRLCVGAVAYCPAVDITLGDYLRAMVTVHARLDPDDRDNYRDALIDAFSRRAIYPPDVESMSESELVWRRPMKRLGLSREVMKALRIADTEGRRDPAAEDALRGFCDDHREDLGFVDAVPLTISPVHQAIRFVGPELDVAEELVCQVTQTVEPPRSDWAPGIVGGTALIFGDDGQSGTLRYAISKRIDDRRQQAQRAWHEQSFPEESPRKSNGSRRLTGKRSRR